MTADFVLGTQTHLLYLFLKKGGGGGGGQREGPDVMASVARAVKELKGFQFLG